MSSPLVAEILRVGGPNPDYPDIATAIAAAQEGDQIQVAGGAYGGFTIHAKSLTIQPQQASSPIVVGGHVTVENIASHQAVQLDGFQIQPNTPGMALSIQHSVGAVRIRNSSMDGFINSPSQTNGLGLRVLSSLNVVVTNCDIQGADGLHSTGNLPPGNGSVAALIFNSYTSFFNTSIEGGDGGWELSLGGTAKNGGHGLLKIGTGFAFMSQSTSKGGDGGWAGAGFGTGHGGDGADGVRCLDPERFRAVSSNFVAGEDGVSHNNGSPGIPLNVGTLHPSSSARLEASTEAFDNSELHLTFYGSPGSQVTYLASDTPRFSVSPNIGPYLVSGTPWVSAGTVGATGILRTRVSLPDLPPNEHLTYHIQGRFAAPNGFDYLSNPCWATVYDKELGNEVSLPLGVLYCTPNAPNSTGNSAQVSAFGSGSIARNEVTLKATRLPASILGYFLSSKGQGLVQNPAGSAGDLCLDGNQAVGRHTDNGGVLNSGGSGTFSYPLDLNQIPTPTGYVAVVAGETWHFQAWHRDHGGISNFTDALSIPFH